MEQYYTNVKAPTLARTFDSDIASSTEVVLNSGTTSIFVSAVGKGIYLKWGAAATSSNFDEFISPDTTRWYVKQAATVQFLQESASATLIVIEK